MTKNRGEAQKITSQRSVAGKAEYNSIDVAPWTYMPDMGCHVNPVRLGCLTCPLPQCIYESKEALARHRALQVQERSKRIRLDRQMNRLTVRQLSAKYGVCERVVQRALAEGRRLSEAGVV